MVRLALKVLREKMDLKVKRVLRVFMDKLV